MPDVSTPRSSGDDARRRRGRSTSFILAAVAVLGLPVLTSGPTASSSAMAAPRSAQTPDEAGDVAARATLEQVQPANPQPGDDLVLSGVITNTGDEPLTNVQALPRYSLDPLGSRTDIRRVATDDSVRWGARYDWVYQQVAEVLEPGASAPFELTLPVATFFDAASDRLVLPGPGVYAIGVELRAGQRDERQTVATARTVIPWLVGEDQQQPDVPVAVLWPLGTPPSLLPDGSVVTDALAGQLGPGGALRGLVDVAEGHPVTWAVDPNLLATVSSMEQGYEVRTGDGPTPGAGSEVAAEWQSAFGKATRNASPWLLPYAVPDIAGLSAADPRAAAELARAAVDTTVSARGMVTSTSARTDVAWSAHDHVDADTLRTYARAGANTVVLPDEAVARQSFTSPHLPVRFDNAELNVLLADGGLSAAVRAALSAPGPASGAVALRQQFLAETAMAALQAGEDQPAPLVAAPPVSWQPDPTVAQALVDVWTTAPWVKPINAGQISASDDAVAPRSLSSEQQAADPALQRAIELWQRVDHVEAVLAGGSGTLDAYRTATLRAASLAWGRNESPARAAYADRLDTDLTGFLDRVSVIVPESVTLSSNTGTFPLTVANDLDQPILVRLELAAANPDRMSVEQVQPIRVEAGERATVEVTAQAVTNGRVPMRVRLVAVDGAPLGPSQQFVVNATDYGTIGWIVVGGSALLFAGGLALRMVRGRRRNGTTTKTSEEEVVAR